MKIVKIKLYYNNSPFRIKFRSAQSSRTCSESVIIQLDFENGISAYGESSPRPYVTGEDRSSVVDLIKDFFARILFAQEINTINDVENVLDEIENECYRRDIHEYNSTLGAVDTALLDGLGKLNKVPVINFLGPIVRKKIFYSLTVPFLHLEYLQALLSELEKDNLKYVKVLVGKCESENVNRVSSVRSILGERVDIRIDANQKWNLQEAISNLNKLEQFNIAAVEQPVAKSDIGGLKSLKKAIEPPIIADESIRNLLDAKRLVEEEACDIFNIKISKCGGLLRSRKIARFARSQNLLCQLGAHVGETEVLDAAGKHFAFTTPDLVYFERTPSMMFEDSSVNLQFEHKCESEDISFNIGLGVPSAPQQSIMRHCLHIVDLVAKQK
ncbi:MAG: enolase C-terminal domain-like protein [Thermotogota bacterium]|nr:enolase C-terminal domain-like protein [Thermotogota bacterium]